MKENAREMVTAETEGLLVTAENKARLQQEAMQELQAKSIEGARMHRGFEVVRSWARQFPDETPVIPKRKTNQAMAYDFTSLETVTLEPGQVYHFITDIKAYMQPTECLILNVRSSIGFKKELMLVNTAGWIDADFVDNPDNDGNIGICLRNMSKVSQTICKGERIAQGAFFSFLSKDNDDLDEKEVRQGGIGSTGTL